MSQMLEVRRNQKLSVAAVRKELSAYRPLGLAVPSRLPQRTWPAVSDRQLDLIRAWEKLLGPDEVWSEPPRPLTVVETFAFVAAVGGELHKVLAEASELAWCGLRSALRVESADAVDEESLRLGVLLHRGWEPRIALASLAFDPDAGYLSAENQWWLAQCPEGQLLTTFEVEHADDDLDFEAGLALVAATRNGSAGPPEIQSADVVLTAARAQVAVAEVVEACHRLAFEVPPIPGDPAYKPDWTDAALAALLLAVAEPPEPSDAGLLCRLTGVPEGELAERLHRLGYVL